MDSVVLGRNVESGEEVRLGAVERRQGTYVIGKSGMGKSTLIESLILQDASAGRGMCVLDPHGDLVENVIARLPSEREPDVILLDPADYEFPFGLNFFQCDDRSDRALVTRVATQAVEVFKKLWGDVSWGPQLEQTLRNCAYTLIENQGYTLTDLRSLLLRDAFRARLVSNVTNLQVREFWELEYNTLRPQDRLQRVGSTLNKVDDFLNPISAPIVGFGKTTVNLRQVMDRGQILLVRLPEGELGEGTVAGLGSTLVGQFLNAALSRQDLAPSQRRDFSLYADEYHRFATPSFAKLLAEARKYAVASTLAHQFRGQLSDDANRGATLSAANLVIFAVNGTDAEELAKQFDRTPPAAEVSGTRWKKAFPMDVVGHLVRVGHENAKVRDLVQHDLAPLVRWSQSIEPDAWVRGSRFSSGGDAIRLGLAAINEYLSRIMAGTVVIGTPEEAALVLPVAVELRGLLGLAPDSVGPQLRLRAFPQVQREALLAYLTASFGIPPGPGKPEQMKPLKRNLALALADEPRQVGGIVNEDRVEDALLGIAMMEVGLIWLRLLGGELLRSPVIVDTGQLEPYFERPRTYADVESEIASDLVNLPKYTAKCRLLQGDAYVEHTVRTPTFKENPFGPEATALRHRIRARTRAVYCEPLADVEERITLRRRVAEDEGGTSRRVPL
jgi:hypothetical protein